MRSVNLYSPNAYKNVRVINKKLCSIIKKDFDVNKLNYPRQFYEKTFKPNGLSDIIRKKNLELNKTTHGRNTLAFITDQVYTTDVDTKSRSYVGKVFTKKSSNQIIKMFDIKKYFDESSKTISNLYLFEKELISFCNLIHKTNNNGNKILVAGNGGSCADAEHFTGELQCTYKGANRPPLSAFSITGTSAALTAWGNDFGFDTFLKDKF